MRHVAATRHELSPSTSTFSTFHPTSRVSDRSPQWTTQGSGSWLPRRQPRTKVGHDSSSAVESPDGGTDPVPGGCWGRVGHCRPLDAAAAVAGTGHEEGLPASHEEFCAATGTSVMRMLRRVVRRACAAIAEMKKPGLLRVCKTECRRAAPQAASSSVSRKPCKCRTRVGWRSLRRALASIWRMRSRVTLYIFPISSSVRS